jgi:hypothetical protein
MGLRCVAERRDGVLTLEDIQFLTFRSGYTNFTSCDKDDTVESCVARGNNGARSRLTINKFLYDGWTCKSMRVSPRPP